MTLSTPWYGVFVFRGVSCFVFSYRARHKEAGTRTHEGHNTNMAFRVTGRVMAGLQRERNDVQIALRKTWKAYEHTDGLVSTELARSIHQLVALQSRTSMLVC